MSNMVTRCPQCQTSFKVTEEHLKIANGAVRCGSCLHVFQARQHWVSPEAAAAPRPVSPPPAATPAAAPSAAPPPSPAPAGKFSFDQSAIDSATSGPAADSPAQAAAPEASAAHKKIEEIGDDDRISDDMDIEDDEPEIVPPKKRPSADAGGFGTPDDDYSSLFDDVDGHDFDALETGDFNDIDELAGENAVDESNTGTSDESWARDMLEEIRKEDIPPPVNLSEVEDVREIFTDFTNPVDVHAARRDLGIDADMATPTTGGKPVGRDELIAQIEPPPVELSSGRLPVAGEWKSAVRWHAAALGLLLLLAVQYVVFHFNDLAKSEATRPYMQALCSTLHCRVPPVENWRYIKISNLVVRQHPTVKDGLAIDAILLNVTRQEQPFPKLELFFSDMVKTPIASRRFEPAEYLAGELSGKTMMPAGRPVHVALEIVNPSPEAVSWNLRVAGKTE